MKVKEYHLIMKPLNEWYGLSLSSKEKSTSIIMETNL